MIVVTVGNMHSEAAGIPEDGGGSDGPDARERVGPWVLHQLTVAVTCNTT